jgi:hypothetical protein
MGNGCLRMRLSVIFAYYLSPCCHYPVSDKGLVGVHRDVLDSDLLLTPTAMLVEPFRRQGYCPRRLVGQCEIFRPGLEIFRRLLPSSPIE